MRNLAIIPARGGSRRIPKKNIKLFKGKPIIDFTIKTVLETSLFDTVMVSTDDPEIAAISKQSGATVPFMRSNPNANDFATLTDVLIEVIKEYENRDCKFDSVCCILPTSALMTKEQVIEGYNQLIKSNYWTVVPVIRYAYPIQRALKEKKGLLQMRELEYLNSRSQDLEPCYHDAGQFYWAKVENLGKEKKIFTNNTGFIELKESEAQDVDTLEDWEMLELKYEYRTKINER